MAAPPRSRLPASAVASRLVGNDGLNARSTQASLSPSPLRVQRALFDHSHDLAVLVPERVSALYHSAFLPLVGELNDLTFHMNHVACAHGTSEAHAVHSIEGNYLVHRPAEVEDETGSYRKYEKAVRNASAKSDFPSRFIAHMLGREVSGQFTETIDIIRGNLVPRSAKIVAHLHIVEILIDRLELRSHARAAFL
jgi:hypothetical protein